MSFRKLIALVVEDEKDHQQALVEALNESIEIEVAGMAESVNGAFDLVKNTPADLLFLDIKLIGGDAFQLISLLKRQQVPIPPVVIQTGHTEFEHAQRILNEFKDEVISILQKPFYEDWEKRRDGVIEAVYARQQAERLARSSPLASPKMVSIQDGRRSYFINLNDIILVKTGVKSQGKTKIVLQHETIDCNLSLSQLLSKLPRRFVQINRYEAINISWVAMLDHSDKTIHLRSGDSCLIGGAFYPGVCEWAKE